LIGYPLAICCALYAWKPIADGKVVSRRANVRLTGRPAHMQHARSGLPYRTPNCTHNRSLPPCNPAMPSLGSQSQSGDSLRTSSLLTTFSPEGAMQVT